MHEIGHFAALKMALMLTLSGAAAAAIAAPSAPPTDSAWHYRVQPGDNLVALTDAYLQDGASWRELQRVNKTTDPLKLAPGSTLLMPLRLLRREASVAQVVFTQGGVSLLRPPALVEVPLAAGATVQTGDRLRTGEQGSVSLRFVDGSRLLIAPGSEVSIEQLLVYGRAGLPSMKLRLNKGNADSKVEKQPSRPADYQLKTPSLNLGVRGTEFRVQVTDDGQATRAEVLEGVVAAGTEPVEAGFGVATVPGPTGLQSGLQRGKLPAAPDLSSVPPLLDRIPLTLTWPALAAGPDVKAWRAQVFADGDFDRLLLDSRSSRPKASWGATPELDNLPDGRYTLRVRAIDALGLEGLATDRPFILKARPEPPFSRTPAANAVVYGDALDLAWTRPQNALKFRLQMAPTPDFTTPRIDRKDIADTELRLQLPPGIYHFRLASIAKDADQGPFGDVQTVTMRPIPPSPEALPPALGDKDLALRWGGVPGCCALSSSMGQRRRVQEPAGRTQHRTARDDAAAPPGRQLFPAGEEHRCRWLCRTLRFRAAGRYSALALALAAASRPAFAGPLDPRHGACSFRQRHSPHDSAHARAGQLDHCAAAVGAAAGVAAAGQWSVRAPVLEPGRCTAAPDSEPGHLQRGRDGGH